MIKIGIIDDETLMTKKIAHYIKSGILMADEVEMSEFSTAEEFLERAKAGEEFHILFTDIQMPEMDGIELGREIKRFIPDLYLVFITSYMEYAAESYRLDAYQYILKQDIEVRLPEITAQILEQIEKEHKKFRILGTVADKEKVYYRNIIFIHKIKGSKYVCYITEKKQFKERISVEELFQELDSKEFVLADRGYIVNMRHIEKICGNVIWLSGDHQVEISRNRIPEVKSKIHGFWKEL